MDRWHGQESALQAAPDNKRAACRTTSIDGDIDAAVVWAGQGIDLNRRFESAASLVRRISEQAQERLHAAACASMPDVQ